MYTAVFYLVFPAASLAVSHRSLNPLFEYLVFAATDIDMNTQPAIGISGCLTGTAVRFDGGHKRMGFAMDELAQWVTFKPVCPEMSIGLSVPRPALRTVQTNEGYIRMRFSHEHGEDITDKMTEFTTPYIRGLSTLSGFIVCAKSPSCGMERVRLYDEMGNRGRKEGTGLLLVR